jgi:hypothetical protein
MTSLEARVRRNLACRIGDRLAELRTAVGVERHQLEIRRLTEVQGYLSPSGDFGGWAWYCAGPGCEVYCETPCPGFEDDDPTVICGFLVLAAPDRTLTFCGAACLAKWVISWQFREDEPPLRTWNGRVA